MTIPNSSRGESRPVNHSRSFVVAGVLAAIVTAILVPLGLTDWLPAVGASSGAVRPIAVLAFAGALWVILFAIARLFRALEEGTSIQHLRNELDRLGPGATAQGGELFQRVVGRATSVGDSAFGNSLVARRLRTLRDAGGSETELTAAMAARSELDHEHSEVSYGPARAVVWALPALGFVGTAAEMSQAIGGLGSSIERTSGYEELRGALVRDVIPPMAGAFGVTLFALGASVLCHLILTWTNSREQRILLEVEEATQELLNTAPAGGGVVSSPAALNGELDKLATELGAFRDVVTAELGPAGATLTDHLQGTSDTMRQLVEQLSETRLDGLGEFEQLLRSIDQRLDRIDAGLGQDLVISRGTRS